MLKPMNLLGKSEKKILRNIAKLTRAIDLAILMKVQNNHNNFLDFEVHIMINEV
jgi:hypothetical protein